MSNKDPKKQQREKNAQSDKQQNAVSGSYKLNTSAVDRLVNADKKTYPKTKQDPGKQYRSNGLLSKIPMPIKALFIKFWFSGAVCFFIFWGLGMYIWDTLDMVVILGVVWGMVNDLLVNNSFHFFEITPDSNNKWMMFPKKKLWTFFANVAYGIVVSLLVTYIYSASNVLLNMLNGTQGKIYLGVEPILFGLFYVVVDMMFVGMKNLVVKIFQDANQKAGNK